MLDDAVVLGLLWEIEEGCREHSCTPHDMSLDVEGDTLLELCRAWLAVQDAPGAVVECNDAKGAWLIAADDAPLSEGQRVRIVKETNDG